MLLGRDENKEMEFIASPNLIQRTDGKHNWREGGEGKKEHRSKRKLHLKRKSALDRKETRRGGALGFLLVPSSPNVK